MFSTILIYAIIIIFLRTSNSVRSPRLLHGATPLMILYPLIYTICTAPLAAGRIVALAGHMVPLSYFVMAGTMIACNGWLDVLLYASTRADIVFSEFPPGEETGLETFAFMGRGHRLGTTTTIEAGAMRMGIGRRREESVEHLYGLDRIGIKGEVTVSVDVAQENEMRSMIGTRSVTAVAGGDNGEIAGTGETGAWDARSVRSGKSFET
jgi:hypothetical protein